MERELLEVNKRITGLETKIDRLTAYIVGDLESPGKLGLYVRVHRHDERLDTLEAVVADNQEDIRKLKSWRDGLSNRALGFMAGAGLAGGGVGGAVVAFFTNMLNNV